MSADLQLDFDKLKDEVTKLKLAISEFEVYSNVFISSTKGILEDNCSEFFSQIEIPLDEIRQNKASVLMEALNNYCEHGETAITELQKKDEDYASKMGGEVNGKQ